MCAHTLQSPASMHRLRVSPEGQAGAMELGMVSGLLWAPAPCRERDQGCWSTGQETRSGLTRTAGHWLHHGAYCRPWLAIDHKALPCQASLLLSQVLEKPSDRWADARDRAAKEGTHPGCRHCPPWLWGFTGREAECHRERMGQLGRVPTPYPHICVAAVLKKILYLHICFVYGVFFLFFSLFFLSCSFPTF